MSFNDVGARVQNIVLAVIFIVIGIVGMVLVSNIVASKVDTIQGTSQNVSENLTQGDWGSPTANDLSQNLGEVTPLAYLGWVVGLILLPLATSGYFAYKAIRG